jgi:ABC-2 type transport system permease protein
MKYFNQVITVTRWEFTRFFKPKNEALGIVILILTSTAFYFGGKYAFSDSEEKTLISYYQDLDNNLTVRLSADFELKKVPADRKQIIIEEISMSKQGILLEKEGNVFIINAYKNTRILTKIKSVIEDYHVSNSLKVKGLTQEDLTALLTPPEINELFIYTDNSKSRVLLAYFFSGLMIMAVFLSFAYQFTAITGEKQLRITEQIVSAIRPQIWMDGKIFGITLTGITSMLTYSVLGIIGGILFFQIKGLPISGILDYLYLPAILLYLPFALTGILIWNALLAAIASAITDPNNSGKSSLMMLPLLFVIASMLVIRDPDKGLAVFLSWFPLTSASAMPIRWAVTEVGFFEVAGSFLVLVTTFYLLRKLAARIFRVSILLSGKEPSWGEIIKLMRESN